MGKWIPIILILFLQNCKSTRPRNVTPTAEKEVAKNLLMSFSLDQERLEALQSFYHEDLGSSYRSGVDPGKLHYDKSAKKFILDGKVKKRTSYFSGSYHRYLEAKHQWLDRTPRPEADSFEEVALLSIHPFLLDSLKESARNEFAEANLFPIFGREQAFLIQDNQNRFLQITLEEGQVAETRWQGSKDQGALFLGEYNFEDSGYCLALVDKENNQLIYMDSVEGTGLHLNEECDPRQSLWLLPATGGIPRPNSFYVGKVGERHLTLLDHDWRAHEEDLEDLSENMVWQVLAKPDHENKKIRIVPLAD